MSYFSPTEFAANLIHQLSRYSLRSNQIWVFIGWHRTPAGEVFTDNTKYAYLHASAQEPEVTAVWLAKDRTLARTMQAAGLRSYYQFSLPGIWYALRAGVTVIDAYLYAWNYAFVGRSYLVQLLHGKGMKATGYLRANLRDHDLICYPSQAVTQMVGDDFKRGACQEITGYPRSDAVLGAEMSGQEIDAHADTIASLQDKRAHGTKIIWYAPTFRRGQADFPVSEILDLPELTHLAEQHNWHIIISLHPKYRGQQAADTTSCVTMLEQQDFFQLFHYVDVLVTDYSSSFTDFLLLNRPIIFYPYDLDTYLKNEGILIDYDQETPGPKVRNAQELHLAITQQLQHDTHAAARVTARARYHDHADTGNSARVIAAINRLLQS